MRFVSLRSTGRLQSLAVLSCRFRSPYRGDLATAEGHSVSSPRPPQVRRLFSSAHNRPERGLRLSAAIIRRCAPALRRSGWPIVSLRWRCGLPAFDHLPRSGGAPQSVARICVSAVIELRGMAHRRKAVCDRGDGLEPFHGIVAATDELPHFQLLLLSALRWCIRKVIAPA